MERPTGGDYAVTLVETPPLRELLPGKYQFTVGLSNDMIGYIIPKSQWDEEAPYSYGYEEPPYGEINSVGAETGVVLYGVMVEVIHDLQPVETGQ